MWQRLDLPRSHRERRNEARAEARLDTLARAKQKRWSSRPLVVVAGSPAAPDRRRGRRPAIGLVIMTRRKDKGFFGPRQGSISYQVLCNAKTPVLALPSDTNGFGARWSQSEAFRGVIGISTRRRP